MPLPQSLQQINFNWGTGAITPYGRDYVSARWTGKLLAPATETYTISGSADDAFRVYLNHTLILDTWEGQGGGDARADVSLTAGQFADLVVEYREETGSARMQLMWSSYSTPPQVIPASALYYALPISGSPWPIDVAPGGATYPWTDATGSGLANATAGQPAEFVIQARDSFGNPLESGDGTAFSVYLDGPGNVELGSDSIGPLVALGNGKFRVTYTATMAGPYKLYVQTASGMDIYCGLGQVSFIWFYFYNHSFMYTHRHCER
jgi:PA14 domain/Filamin/ABP280 repeat